MRDLRRRPIYSIQVQCSSTVGKESMNNLFGVKCTHVYFVSAGDARGGVVPAVCGCIGGVPLGLGGPGAYQNSGGKAGRGGFAHTTGVVC